MLDSPYVRRVAISLQQLGLRFEHEPLSVFRTYGQFQAINPVVKAPTLVCDDGQVLMDSTLILLYAEALAKPLSLMPATTAELPQALRTIGLALQIFYEHGLRPPEKRHEPWLERVGGQLQAAFGELEADLGRRPGAVADLDRLDQAGITTAVAWHFTQQMVPGVVSPERHPRLAAVSAAAEALPAFRAAAPGDGVCRPG